MACLFGCFRFQTDEQRRNHLISNSIDSKKNVDQDELVERNHLGSLFLKEDECGLPSEKVVDLVSQGEICKDNSYRELRHEAEFLKSCGALLQTPVEIRKASVFLTDENSGKGELSSYSKEQFPDATSKKLFCNEEFRQLSRSPSEALESSQTSNNNTERKEEHQTMELQESSSLLVSLHDKGDFEDIEDELDIKLADADKTGTSTYDTKFQVETFASRNSPFPTPWKLSDEMQTPATVYPADLNAKPGRNTRARIQYINPVSNPVENVSQWKLLTESSHPNNLDSSECRPNCVGEKMENISLTPIISNDIFSECTSLGNSIGKPNGEVSDDNECLSQNTISSLATPTVGGHKGDEELAIASLSDWLKPAPTRKALVDEIGSGKKSHSGKSSDADRPIIGMVAAHWSDEEKLKQSPKRWDGNGIPNSTNKYKEDQTVSWHVTPFEERLEKALSDESFLP